MSFHVAQARFGCSKWAAGLGADSAPVIGPAHPKVSRRLLLADPTQVNCHLWIRPDSIDRVQLFAELTLGEIGVELAMAGRAKDSRGAKLATHGPGD